VVLRGGPGWRCQGGAESIDASADQEAFLAVAAELLGPVDEPAVCDFQPLVGDGGVDLVAQTGVVAAAGRPVAVVKDVDAR
jgi:hypothetical protein